MKELKALIKSTFNLWVKRRWLKGIEKSIKKRDKAYENYKHHHYVANELMKEYNAHYENH